MRFAVVTLVGAVCTVSNAQNVTFQGLGRGPNPAGWSQDACVSLDGTVAGGTATAPGANPSGGQTAFRWTAAGGLQEFGPVLGDPRSAMHGLNADGSVAVGFTLDSPQHGWLWTATGGMTPIDPLPGDDGSDGAAASADGSVIAVRSWRTGFGWSAALWTAQTGSIAIGSFAGQSYVWAISADGQVIVGGADGTAFRWTSALGIQPIADGGTAIAVNADGSVVVGAGPASLAFRWTTASGNEVLVDPNGGYMSIAYGVSGDGDVVVGQRYAEAGWPDGRAMYWTREFGVVDLNEYFTTHGIDLTGWVLYEASGISGDGQVVVGTGRRGDVYESWIAHIPRCGSADFNGDGDTGTDADIEAFFACLAGDCCGTCGTADFNADGDVGTDADIEAFFRVLGGGTC